MNRSLAAAGAILFAAATPGTAHRLDEYLQATLFSVETDRVGVQVRLTPGVAVFRAVLAGIDADADGFLSDGEQRAYAERVLRDLSLTVDGRRLRLGLVSTQFPKIEELKEGLGAIRLDFRADVPSGGSDRTLVFENRHQKAMGAYLVNALVPRDPGIRITTQKRNEDQSVYELRYVQPGGGFAWWSGEGVLMGLAALLVLGRLAWLWPTWKGRRPENQAVGDGEVT